MTDQDFNSSDEIIKLTFLRDIIDLRYGEFVCEFQVLSNSFI